MNIVFIGSITFSEKILIQLINMKANIKGVCTLKSAHNNSDHVDLTEISIKNKIPVKYTNDINSENSIKWIKSLSPDIIFCFGWSRLLKNHLLNLAPLGILGYHPASLPANRGRHPIIWSLALGMTKTSSTFFFMDEGADSGNILSQYQVPISINDNASSLYKKLINTAIEQVNEFMPALELGNFKSIKQDHNKANYWRKRGIEDGKIDWRMSADSINNLVRALSKPYPGAHFFYKEESIKVWKTKVVKNEKKNIEPGKILAVSKNGILVKAGIDSICLMDINPILDIKLGSYL